MKTFYVLLGICLLSIVWALSSSAKMISPSYEVTSQVINAGGLLSASENFHQISAIGQSTAIGISQSAGFRNHAGFIFQISISQPPTGVCGDADNNGTVDIFDALLIAEYDAYLKTEAQVPGFALCDVDNSGTVDIFDALKVAECDAGIISCFSLSCPGL